MSRTYYSMLLVAIAALLVGCSADQHQEQNGNEHSSASQYDVNGQKPKSSELSNLVRGVREARRPVYNIPYPLAGQRRYEWISPFRAPLDYPKRNFDEIDRSALDQFMRKRNFDEIDLSNMPLPYATKRFFHIYGGNNIDIPMSGYDKKTYRQEYPMDEIDLSSFPIGSKRSNLRHQFDEIDLSSFPVGSKRARSGQFDEIDLSSFPIG